jgi:hypothetical protein
MKAHAIQYTIRGVPHEVDRALRERAKRQKLSINQVILDELSKATIGRTQKADFSDLVGRWLPDPVFDEIVESQRQVDPSDWK